MALAFVMNDVDVDQAVNIARLDEQYQQSIFGVVEGAHDYDQAHTQATFMTIKSMLNLSLLR